MDDYSAAENDTYELAGRGASATGYFSESDAFIVLKGVKFPKMKQKVFH